MTVVACVAARAAELPTGATLLDGDLVWDMWDADDAVVSPDGKQVAYISRGAVWACGVTQGPPTKLAELPNTSTAFMAMPEFAAARLNFKKLRGILDFDAYQERIQRPLIEVMSLKWTPSQDGVVYGLRQRYQNNGQLAVHRVMHASLAGMVSEVAAIERDVGEKPHNFNAFHVTADRQFVVAYADGYSYPVIWNVSTESPVATCYDYLLPSTTSRRYLGIEIDTRQLVLVDENFGVAKRFDVTFSSERQCDIIWSANERFALCRQCRDYPSQRWIAQRLDLETGQKRGLKGPFFTDRIEFTGRGGEFVVWGIMGMQTDHVDRMTGARILIVPDGGGPPRDLARYEFEPKRPLWKSMEDRIFYPEVRHNADFTLFTTATPRDDGKSAGYLMYLIDLHGNRWPMGDDDRNRQIAPFHVVAFANGGETIVGRSESTLFSIPVSAIRKEAADDAED